MSRNSSSGKDEEFDDPFATSDFDDPFALQETDEERDLATATPARHTPLPAATKPASGGFFGLFGAPKPPTAASAATGSSVVSSPFGSKPSTAAASSSSASELDADKPVGAAPLPNINIAAALASTQVGMAALAQSRAAATPTATGGSGQYLNYSRRSLWGQTAYNVGYSYFGGLMLGGAYGLLYGLRNSPVKRFRIILNSVLNGSGKYGAKAGNAAGVMAMLYTVVARQLEDVEVDAIPRWLNNATGVRLFSPKARLDWLIPAASAFATGVLFTLPRALTMRGLDKHYVSNAKRLAVMVSGGLATTAAVAALSVVGPMAFGERSPFRLAN